MALAKLGEHLVIQTSNIFLVELANP
jgi:hypothetical protein